MIKGFEIVEVREQSDGSIEVDVDLTSDFIKEYKKLYGLKKWSHKHFQNFFNEALKYKVEYEKKKPKKNSCKAKQK